MQPSSLPASLGDAAIVSAGSARADHMHTSDQIADFAEAAKASALPVTTFEFSNNHTSYGAFALSSFGASAEPGVYAAKLEVTEGDTNSYIEIASANKGQGACLPSSTTGIPCTPTATKLSPVFFVLVLEYALGSNTSDRITLPAKGAARLTLIKIL